MRKYIQYLTVLMVLSVFIANTVDAYAAVRTYPVQKTGTVADVAKRNGVSVEDLCQWNNLQPGEWIEKGQQLYLQEPVTPVHSRQKNTEGDPLALLDMSNVLLPKIRTGMLACPSGGKDDVRKKKVLSHI